MNINWKLRLQNKATLTALVMALVYQALGVCGVVPRVSQDQVTTIIGMVINILCLLGIVVDPTTAGVGDSVRAMSYDKPKKYE
jgi:phi LC3 family holin